jgi:23S rRNA (guanosine2251-2'-O)-methyltransferase
MLIEGRNIVEQAVDGNGTVDKVFIFYGLKDNALIDKVKKSGVVYQFVDRPVLDRMSKTKNHQGIMAFVTDYKYFNIDEVIDKAYEHGEQPIILILDGIEDPHNLGNIMRTAECMGVDGIILPKNRSVAVNDTAIRVSQGAASNIQICKVVNINQEIERLKNKGFWIYAVEVGGVDVSKVNLIGPIALILGSEGAGVHQLTRKLADGIVSVKMHGKINSLNVGSAAAMVLYEANRQRGAK